MAKTLDNVAKEVAVAEIKQYGEKLILPEGMGLDVAIDLLERRREYLEEETEFTEHYDVMPFDGANALAEVLVKKFGWAPQTSTPGFFGKNPPRMLSVKVGFGVNKSVPWGRFSLPNISGHVECGVSRKNGRFCFSLEASVLRKDEAAVRSLCNDIHEFLKEGSIYKGKAVKIRFLDDDGDALSMPEVDFLDVSKIDPNSLIYAKPVQDAVETNLFTPINRIKDCIANNIPVKRGVLLGGVFGTGKTMAATVASRLAVDNGLTYLYVPRADELSMAIEFAKQYQSPACVIFCEDIDRVTSGERSVEMDDILNILDGIDTKGANIITVLTTNDLDAINPAMLRPGRLDAVIDVTPPDAAAAIKLVRLYGRESISADLDLTEVGIALDGLIPAVIAEVVKRAKLSQMRLQEPGTPVLGISSDALLEAAKTMRAQVELLNRKKPEAGPTLDTVLGDVIKAAIAETQTASVETKELLDNVSDRLRRQRI